MYKKNLFIIFLMILNMSSYAQTNNSRHAIITKTILENSVQYKFTSNLYIDEFKKQPKEQRVLNHHNNMLNLNIDTKTQVVTFEYPSEISQELMIKIIYHFKYSTYEIR